MTCLFPIFLLLLSYVTAVPIVANGSDVTNSSTAEPLVDLGYSRYLGTALPNGISQWLGIRYAAPPLGELRFRAPMDPPVNDTVQVADQVGSRASTIHMLC